MGNLRLLREGPEIPVQPVDSGAHRDAWGRFITNEGGFPAWWLQLTQVGKEMINDKRNPADAEPAPTLDSKEKTTRLTIPPTR